MNLPNQKRNTLIQLVIELVIGLLFIIFPTQFQNFIVYVIGGLLVALGIYIIIYSYKFSELKQIAYSGIFFIVVGAIIMFINNLIVALIPIIIGIYLILKGLVKLYITYIQKGSKFYLINLIISGLIVISGIILIIFNGQQIIGHLLGSIIILDALFTLFKLLTINKNQINLDNLFNQSNNHNKTGINDTIIDVEYEEHDKKGD